MLLKHNLSQGQRKNKMSLQPNVSEEEIFNLVHKWYNLEVDTVKELNSYHDRNFYIKVNIITFNVVQLLSGICLCRLKMIIFLMKVTGLVLVTS